MSRTSSTQRKQPTTSRWWWVVSVGLIVIGLLVVILAPRGPSQGPTIPAPIGNTGVPTSSAGSNSSSDSTTTSDTSSVGLPALAGLGSYTLRVSASSALLPTSSHPTQTAAAQAVVKPPARSRPVKLMIPSLGISVSVGILGLNKDGTVQVPTNFAQPGWYKFGPTPGQLGSAVILGHVDSFRGPAVFFRIGKMQLGNRVIVKEADGKTFTFAVIGVRMYSKSKFPDYLVYGPRPYAALQLVTCGGVFDHQTGSYLSNIVVFTKLVK